MGWFPSILEETTNILHGTPLILTEEAEGWQHLQGHILHLWKGLGEMGRKMPGCYGTRHCGAVEPGYENTTEWVVLGSGLVLIFVIWRLWFLEGSSRLKTSYLNQWKKCVARREYGPCIKVLQWRPQGQVDLTESMWYSWAGNGCFSQRDKGAQRT